MFLLIPPLCSSLLFLLCWSFLDCGPLGAGICLYVYAFCIVLCSLWCCSKHQHQSLGYMGFKCRPSFCLAHGHWGCQGHQKGLQSFLPGTPQNALSSSTAAFRAPKGFPDSFPSSSCPPPLGLLAGPAPVALAMAEPFQQDEAFPSFSLPAKSKLLVFPLFWVSLQ